MFLFNIPSKILVMKTLKDYKEELHSCSKCGLCQSVCPIYKITGNDCTVSKGHFIMLQGLIKNELKMSKTINKYLNLCLKCSACSKFCPSGIDVVDIVALAKAEYFKLHKIEKTKSAILKAGIDFIHSLNNLKTFKYNLFSPKKFDKKVIYFAGCGGVQDSVIKILNSINIEVITPNFDCCGYPFFVRGDMESFKEYADKFYSILKKYENYDVVVNCAICGKTLKSYKKWFSDEYNIEVSIKNVFEYIKENNLSLELKKNKKVTYHKPCNLENFETVKYIIENTKNIEYVEMKDYDKCCGGVNVILPDFKTNKALLKLINEKGANIKSTGAKTVLTSCLACQITLSLFSWGRYRVQDFVEFLAKNVK